MFFTKTALLLAVLPFTIAATCDSSNALIYSPSSRTTTAPVPTSTGGSSSLTQAENLVTCNNGCGTDASCTVNCLTTACTEHCGDATSSCYVSCLTDPCSAFFGSGSDSPDVDALKACYLAAEGGRCASSGCKRALNERAEFSCSSSQTCYMETNGNLFCLNTSTGDYTDISGGNGNVDTGDYTSAASSASSSTTSSAESETTAGSASTTTARSASTTTAGSSRTTASNAATSASSAAATSATPNAGQEMFRADAVIGAVGLVLGLVL